VSHVRELDSHFMPLLRKEFIKVTYYLAKEMHLPHKFNDENKSAR
jgi:hypothetical protein